ncbi:unnamed protein product [Linum tenue]|uniref:FAD-binding PCMH-type domain-containing protein n=1 Tax=Linum tenue TaxID=586396 RepID=A0AAV0QKM5_9ROSI|nr:unnamed protein product [Linum tenue]
MDTAHRSFPILVALFVLLFGVTSSQPYEEFLQCLEFHDSNITSIVYTRANSSFSSLLESSIRNPRFDTSATPKPLLIFTPRQISHIQSAIRCSRAHRIQIRVRSGGHDYEGLSYSTISPSLTFLVLDLRNLRAIQVDVPSKTAWAQAGATLGELYYAIAAESRTLAFPAGMWPTVGLGGHISGGGYGSLLRKHGIAADNVVDAQVVDVEGRILDRASMGEDLFWAIRGGGGNTFGIVVAWKLSLVSVPPTVTLFTVSRTAQHKGIELFHRWQHVVDKLPDDLIVMASLSRDNGTILASFDSLFLGKTDALLPLLEQRFPELGVSRSDCIEMSWIQSILYSADFPINGSLEVLRNRTTGSAKFKGKSDYVKEPIPISGFEGIWEKLKEVGVQTGGLILASYGGKMSEIPESSIPFPHRAGNIYQVEEVAFWVEDGVEAADGYLNWLRGLYEYMTPYVSKNPREAYANYRDLDIGRSWGSSYYKNNFDRLVRVKTAVDPANFFRNEQSIPPLSSWR